MKYIRTEDGIYSLEKATICRYKNKEYVCPIRKEETFEEHRSREYQFIGPKWEVIKYADTIEELCDEIIGILNLNIDVERYETSLRIGDKLWFDDLEDAQFNKKYCSEIYGAIWTDKGLIFVAKMNAEGNFELL